MTEPDRWILMPCIDNVAMTLDAVGDGLAQSVPTRVLLIDQGSSQASREALDAFIDQRADHRVLCWHYLPALPSLSAVWNRALRFVWELGGEEALVVNNDVRLHRQTVEVLGKTRQTLEALFVTAVGVREGQYNPDVRYDPVAGTGDGWLVSSRGGPDFSCFLISREGHLKYPFDEGFIPAYGEDCDTHRRYMLGGDGARIFSVNLPFLHLKGGSRTINQSPEAKAAFEKVAGIGRAHYERKWGGPPNRETFRAPFGEGPYAAWLTAALLDPALQGNALQTTPELQRWVQRREGGPVADPQE